MRKASFEFLKELLSTPSPSGFESAGQKLWCKYARACGAKVHTDSYGNAVAALNPAGDPKIMLDGHADEIGLMVKHIDEDGFVYFQRLGGVNQPFFTPAEIRQGMRLAAVGTERARRRADAEPETSPGKNAAGTEADKTRSPKS